MLLNGVKSDSASERTINHSHHAEPTDSPIWFDMYWLYCNHCKEVFDLWKYDDMKDTSHAGHDTRYLSDQETDDAALACAREGCLDEEFLSGVVTAKQEEVRDYVSGLTPTKTGGNS